MAANAEPIEMTRLELTRLYDLYRDLSLNVRYYGHRLKWYRRHNLVLQIVVAGGTSTTLAGLLAGSVSFGKNVWSFVALVAAVGAVATPFLNLANRIAHYAKLYEVYSKLFQEAESLLHDIHKHGSMTPDDIRRTEAIVGEYGRLGPEDEPAPSRRLLKRFEAEVKQAIPVDSLWLPS
jgi:hypothetical protein